MRRLKMLAICGVCALAGAAFAASHNDAPMIMTDPGANISDVYAFIGNGASGKVLNIIMNVNPLSDPGNGVNYYRFGDDILYSVHIARPNASDVFTGAKALTYNFRFKSNLKNQGTILSYGLGTAAGAIQNTDDAQQNMTQTYMVYKNVGPNNWTLGNNISAGMTLKVPPVNVGIRTTPNYYDAGGNVITGATSIARLDVYTRETIYTLADGSRVWAGQREDGFFADVPAIFDFLGVRNPAKDGFSGYNTHTIAMQVPISSIVAEGSNPMVGVYATTARQKVRVVGGLSAGPWVQIGRMGNPLFNETLVALRDKDRYNMTQPTSDAATFKTYAENCELAFLLNAVLGTLQVNNRTDLVGFFIPDLLKVDTSTAAVPLAGDAAFNRLSVFGGDTVFSPFQNGQAASGWPNGRRLGDDVVDIALTAIASGPSYTTITVIGDNVNGNDSLYNGVFPYSGTPFGGPTTTLH